MSQRLCRFKEPTLLRVRVCLNTRFRCRQKVQILCTGTKADAGETIGAVLMPTLVPFYCADACFCLTLPALQLPMPVPVLVRLHSKTLQMPVPVPDFELPVPVLLLDAIVNSGAGHL